MANADDVLDGLKAKLLIGSDSRLARELGVARSTLATWRKRGTVPPDALYGIAKRFGLSASFFSHNRLSLLVSDQLVFGLIAKLFDEAGDLFGTVGNPQRYARLSNIAMACAPVFDLQLSGDRIGTDNREEVFYRSLASIDVDYANDVLKAFEHHRRVPPIPIGAGDGDG